MINAVRRSFGRFTLVALLGMSTCASTCSDPNANAPTSGSVDDQARALERLVRVHEFARESTSTAETDWQLLGERLISADMLGRAAYFHCLSVLNDADGELQNAANIRPEFSRDHCPIFRQAIGPQEADHYIPGGPSLYGDTCGAEVCFVEVASCVSTTLMNIAGQAGVMVTREMTAEEIPLTLEQNPAPPPERRLEVRQQTAAANARIAEVALGWCPACHLMSEFPV